MILIFVKDQLIFNRTIDSLKNFMKKYFDLYWYLKHSVSCLKFKWKIHLVSAISFQLKAWLTHRYPYFNPCVKTDFWTQAYTHNFLTTRDVFWKNQLIIACTQQNIFSMAPWTNCLTVAVVSAHISNEKNPSATTTLTDPLPKRSWLRSSPKSTG